MSRFYATFGAQYAYQPHPTLLPEVADPDGVMEVLAPTYAQARSLVVALTEVDGVAHFSDLMPWFDEDDPDEVAAFRHFYPRGVTSRITFEQLPPTQEST